MNNKSNILQMPRYFDRYIHLVEEENLSEAFENSIQVLENLNRDLFKKIQKMAYAEGKWSINEIFQHIIDFERIFNYRTLLFARNFPEAQPGFNEDVLAARSKANNRDITEIVEELILVRKASYALFKSFDAEDLQKIGINWESEISVLAMGFNMIGHQVHHLKVIEERYFHL